MLPSDHNVRWRHIRPRFWRAAVVVIGVEDEGVLRAVGPVLQSSSSILAFSPSATNVSNTAKRIAGGKYVSSSKNARSVFCRIRLPTRQSRSRESLISPRSPIAGGIPRVDSHMCRATGDFSRVFPGGGKRWGRRLRSSDAVRGRMVAQLATSRWLSWR